MFRIHSTTFLIVLLSSLSSSSNAWTMTRMTNSRLQMQAIRSSRPSLQAGIFFGPPEEEECPDEEECEINWDLMPNWDEEEKDEPIQVTPNSMGAQIFEDSKVRLEMKWQIDECETDEDSCEDFCADCAGNGKTACRFCRGTSILTLNDEFRSCILCEQGKVDCASCRGTGWIAPWATTMGDHLDRKTKTR